MVAAMWPSSDSASPQPPAGRAVPSLGPFAELVVKVLAAAMALARAAGVDDQAAFAPFVAATAVLERDLAALHRQIDQGADDGLAAAAEVAAVHLADLAEMARQVARPGGHQAERERAAAVAGRLQTLLEELAAAPVDALQPQPPVPGAPDREGSRPGARGNGVVHSPRPELGPGLWTTP